MSKLVSIDPGVYSAGTALWEDGELQCAFFADVTPGSRKAKELASYPFPLVHLVLTMLPIKLFYGLCPDEPLAVAIEQPQTYGGRASRGDTNDLIALAQTVGTLSLGLSWRHAVPATRYYPYEWKGQTPKLIMVERIKEQLTAAERARVVLPGAKDKQHNVWDGIGVGLHHQGRLG